MTKLQSIAKRTIPIVEYDKPIHGRHCDACPLNGQQEPSVGRGEPNSRFVMVTGPLSSHEKNYGRMLSKGAATFLGKSLSAERFGKEDVFLYPAVRCVFDDARTPGKEKTLIKKCCSNYVKEMAQDRQPEVLIPMGAEAARQVYGKAVKITKIRGIPERMPEVYGTSVVLPFIDPQLPVLYPQHEAVFASDCATLGRLVDFGYNIGEASASTHGEYTIINDLQFLIDQNPTVIAFDTEGRGLAWHYDYSTILTMQFCIEPGKAYLLPWNHPDSPPRGRLERRKLRRQLVELLCAPGRIVVGQNTKYDCTMLAGTENIRFTIGGDTLMLATLIDENATTKNLDDLVKRYVPDMAGYADQFNNEVDKENMHLLPLDDKFVAYGCGDADAALRLYYVLYGMVAEDSKLLAHYTHVTLPALNALASVELRGLHVDQEQADAFEAYMEEKLAADYKRLLSQVPRSIKRHHMETCKDPEKALQFSRPAFVRDWLFTHPDGLRLKPKVFTKTTDKLDEKDRVPSISTKDHLPYFYDVPVVQELAEYIKAERILTSNIRGFKNKYIIDGMVRPTYNLHKAVTGRSSSENPNGQNIPKRGEIATVYRKMFVAPPGYVVLEADLSQAELRIAADMANDRVMLEIFRTKGDIHTATALLVMGVTMEEFKALSKEVQKSARTKSKAVNFGFLYGMWWRKFVAYAKTQYGVEFTDKESKALREGFFNKYYNLEPWHEKAKAFAHKHGYVRSYSGRIRHLPTIYSEDEMIKGEAERQAVNSPVQEFASSLGLMAAGRIEQEVDPQYLALIGFVHDALYALVPEKYAEWGAKTLKWYMQSNPIEEWFGVTLKVPIEADVGLGYNFGEVAEMGEINVNADGSFEVGEYDFSALWDEEKQKGLRFNVEQEIPPGMGLLPHVLA